MSINLENYLTSNDKYPERATSAELTEELKATAETFLKSVNDFLTELGVSGCVVSSGFRTQDANSKIPNAVKKSLHLACKAIDIEDDGQLAKLVKANPDLLRKYKLFLENPAFTKTWVHLDCGDRADRPSRMFNP